jgi:hypothetical protein
MHVPRVRAKKDGRRPRQGGRGEKMLRRPGMAEWMGVGVERMEHCSRKDKLSGERDVSISHAA